ncbi:MAG: hydroxyisourate hydrolase [Candidatus Eisenbacteria bacterium]|uniref:5-hydroxyisourate hydrolase n=1 Tax=Eiseniibacteriota bacterium TaxID=2212470 RepID=A0A933SCQ8_UNCEI|nr:hydroxyisourate hydrolase [Candidatus Eisenbacteria bacterium]
MSAITTHVLDLSTGRPAANVAVKLERKDDSGWRTVADRTTDGDGRVRDFLAPGEMAAGLWRLTFGTGPYFAARGTQTFLPEATITFEVFDAAQHHHVPLLVSPFGFSTYRGS